MAFSSSLKLMVMIGTMIYTADGKVPITNSMKSFSNVIKHGEMTANTETTVYENDDGPGVITEQWFTGWIFDENTILKIYVDEEIETNAPSIECKLYKCHSIGYTKADEQEYTPWSTKRIGHNAYNGGLFNTYQIPFASKIKITLQVDVGADFYYMVRGVLNYPIIIGNLQLPSNAKLKLYKNEDIVIPPLTMVTLANITNTSGALLQIFMAANSTNYNWIEGCYRVKIDNDTVNGHPYQFLSSGVEDFYLSGFAFDAGTYHGENSGCTYYRYGANDYNMTISAYKFFENDPILFSNKLSLLWKAGSNGDCPNIWPPNKGDFESASKKPQKQTSLSDDTNTIVTTYTWVYEYQFE